MRSVGGRGERGSALVVVTFVLITVLVGGLAAVALTNGELAGTRGQRSRAVVDACAQAALEKVRLLMPDATVGALQGTLQLKDGSTTLATLSFTPGHYTGAAMASTAAGIATLPSGTFDATTLNEGFNVANRLTGGRASGGAAGSGGDAAGKAAGVGIYNTTVTCSGAGYPAREMQLIVRYGTGR